MDPSKNIYKDNKIGRRIIGFGVIMFLLFIICAVFILMGSKCYRTESIIIGSIWVVGVPIFFFLEHVILFKKYGDPTQYDQFRRVQDLAAKIWAGAIVVLAAFFAETFPK